MSVKKKKCFQCKVSKKFLPGDFIKVLDLWYCLPCAIKVHPDAVKNQLKISLENTE